MLGPLLLFFISSNATITVQEETCELVYSYSPEKYSLVQLENARQLLIEQRFSVVGGWFISDDRPPQFVSVDNVKAQISKVKRDIEALSKLDVPKEIETAKSAIVRDAEFMLWKDLQIQEVISTGNLDGLKKNYRDVPVGTECGFIVDYLLKDPSKRDAEAFKNQLRSRCNKQGESDSICMANVDIFFKGYKPSSFDRPRFVWYQWANCANSLYRRFDQHRKYWNELKLKSVSSKCDHFE